jgi:2-dehydropantoate 2-reductase
MRIAVYGAGGVGGYFGGRLAMAGNEVGFIARGENLKALRASGLKIESTKGDFTIPSVTASDEPAEIGPVDLVILAVKAWQVPEVAPAIRPMIGPETIALPLQNGVEAYDQLANVLGPQHVIGGLCRIISYLVEPGYIRHVGFEPSVAFAEWDNLPSPRTGHLLETFLNAGIETSIPSNFQSALWQKFLFIAGYGGIGAVTRAPAGIIRKLPETRALIERGMREVRAVATARGVALAENAVDQALAGVDKLPDDATSSMQRDVVAGRPSELEAKNGAVVRMGAEIGVETPVNSFVYHSLLPSELRARGIAQF